MIKIPILTEKLQAVLDLIKQGFKTEDIANMQGVKFEAIEARRNRLLTAIKMANPDYKFQTIKDVLQQIKLEGETK